MEACLHNQKKNDMVNAAFYTAILSLNLTLLTFQIGIFLGIFSCKRKKKICEISHN